MCLPIFGGRAILADENGSITSGASPFSKGYRLYGHFFLMIPGIVYGVVIGKYKMIKMSGQISARALPRWETMYSCASSSPSLQTSSPYQNSEPSLRSREQTFKHDRIYRNPAASGPIFLSCIVNIFIGSASAKWAILAPVFIPMMMLMGFGSGDHTGRLSNRRFHHKPAVSVIYIPSGHSGLCSQV